MVIYGIVVNMEETALDLAINKAHALPKDAQEQIGRDVLLRIEKLERLRADLEIGIDQLDAGEGKEFDMNDFVARARAKHGA